MEFLEFDDEFQEWQELIDEAERRITKKALQQPIGSLPPKPCSVISSDASVAETVDLLVQNSIGAVAVVEDDRLVGIFSERDLLRLIAAGGYDVLGRPVSEVMTREPKTLRAEAQISDALHLMHKGGYRHVPIVDASGHPAGMVSVRDLVAFAVEHFPQEVLNLPPHPIRAGARTREGA